MKLTKLSLLGAVLISGVAFATTSASAAQEVNSNGTVWSSEGTATFQENTGPGPDIKSPLRIENVTDISFGNHQQVSGDDHTYKGVFNGTSGSLTTPNVVVNDSRGSNVGWTLQLSNTQFTNAADATDKLDNAVLTFKEVYPVSKNNYPVDEAPTIAAAVHLDGTDAPVSILNAAAGTGVGTWTNNFGAEVDASTTETTENSAIELYVPGRTTKTVNASYVSVLTWTLLDAPGK
ncbi:WxL domain-containing protein [Carnobacterium gallinarum]|uniref:WxL domain-containing protein n=1 Tax=Carnobacterium gallinarum TaxID=2749 RepID=UPI000551A024|nr:WxL domain-containing protein [Carnobacterium gallinarum]